MMIGQTISHYKIIEKLGEGGMGEVYLAEDTKLKRKVALKFLPKEFTRDKEAVERFQREAQAAAALSHPHIVTIYEINEYEDQTYIAMEYVAGKTLKEVIASRPLPVAKVIEIATQICEGLQKAHESDIVHRDIKPQNILIDKDNRVKILDFGLAKLKGVSQLTREQSTLGTTHYLSPEQALGKEVDHRSDIWSLGVILYEMLTGQLPFKGDYEQAVIYTIINEEPESLLEIKPQYPAALDQIIKKALEKKPQYRYQNIEGFRNDLQSLPIGEKNTVLQNKNFSKKSHHNRRLLTIGLSILIPMAIIMVGYLILNKPEKATVRIDSLAVLPLENLSGDPGQDYFSDGMTEALITELSRIKALKVISRTSVMRFKDTRESLPEIARQLKVAAVVEGSVLKAGNRVRITTQLIEAASDKHLWAESYERDLKDILSLQKEVARNIAGQVKATLTPDEKTKLNETYTIDPAAHEAFLKGDYFLKKVTVKDAQKAIDFFDRVIELEPEFAPAYTGKAEAYDMIASLGDLPSGEGWTLVKTWAEKALKIDPDNADALMLIADVKYMYDWDWTGAEEDFKKSIRLNPNNTTAYNWYAMFLSSMGRNGEAITMIKKALDLAPLSIGSHHNAVWIFLDADKVKEAEVIFKKFRELFPGHPLLLQTQLWLYVKKGQYQKALEFMESPGFQAEWVPTRVTSKIMMALVYTRTGHKEKAIKILDQLVDLSQTQHVSAFSVALIFSALGEIDQAFLWLEKAYKQRSDMLPEYMKSSSPLLDNLRPDPRFQDLLKRMKLDQ